MSALAIQCGKCRAPVPEELFNHADFAPCGQCATPLKAEVYPARYRAAPLAPIDAVVGEEEASCFFHPEKRAVLSCEACGRFICRLCDCEIRGQHLCPTCLESGRRKEKIENIETSRVLYDRIAFALAIYPVIFYPLMVITAPAALFVAIRYWNAPSSILPRTKIRFVIAIIAALVEIAGIALLIYGLAIRR